MQLPCKASEGRLLPWDGLVVSMGNMMLSGKVLRGIILFNVVAWPFLLDFGRVALLKCG